MFKGLSRCIALLVGVLFFCHHGLVVDGETTDKEKLPPMQYQESTQDLSEEEYKIYSTILSEETANPISVYKAVCSGMFSEKKSKGKTYCLDEHKLKTIQKLILVSGDEERFDIYRISRAGFCKDGTEAVVMININGGPLAGSSSYIYLTKDKTENTWKIIRRELISIS
ncbi:MAG: hypothetical protein LLG02_08050 [Pelosinus sp.]|nr:hypothetical protein [Pelosinus sp.]